MFKSLSKIALIAVFIFASMNAFSQSNVPIGIVDVTVIAEQLPESKEAEKKLQNLQKSITDSLASMQESFQKRVEAYVKQKGMMQPAEQQKQEQAFRAEEQQILMYREQKLQELQVKREEFLEPIRKRITDAIEVVAKEQKLKVVLDKSSAIVLYSEDKMDITYKVLDKIKTGNK